MYDLPIAPIIGPIYHLPINAPPYTKRFNLKYDELLSNFAFQINMRRYTKLAQEIGALSAAGSALWGDGFSKVK